MLDKMNELDQVYDNLDLSVYSFQNNDIILNCFKTEFSQNMSIIIFKMKLTQYVFFLVLVSILTASFTAVLVVYIFQRMEQDRYYFTPDYRVMAVVKRDLIDSEEKLASILRNYTIDKDNAPEIGALVALDEKGLYIISVKDKNNSYNIKALSDVPVHNYQDDGYIFIPNIQTIFQQFVLAEKIKTKEVLKNIKKNNNINNDKIPLLQIGAYIWKNQDGQYSILLEKDIIKEHLTDPSKNDYNSINQIKE